MKRRPIQRRNKKFGPMNTGYGNVKISVPTKEVLYTDKSIQTQS